MFLTGVYDETWTVLNFRIIYAYVAVMQHRDCSDISPRKMMRLQFHYCNTQVSTGKQLTWNYGHILNIWNVQHKACTVLHGRKGKQITGNSKEQNNLRDHLLIMSCSPCILLLLWSVCLVLLVLVLITSCVSNCRSYNYILLGLTDAWVRLKSCAETWN